MIEVAVDTKTKILDAAEKLFGNKGFDATSLRDITAGADVNLAAVNYHFQTKESLIDAVIARRLEPVNRRRLEMLAAAGAKVAVFDVNPGAEAGGQTSITVRYYHAVDADPAQGIPTDDYVLFETFTVVRPRSDGRRWHPKEPPAAKRAAS